MRGTAIALAVFAVTAFVPALAAAQAEVEAPATTFAELAGRGVLEEGKDIVITFRFEESTGYVEIDGNVVRLSGAAIVVRTEELPEGRTSLDLSRVRGDEWEIEIPEHRVQRIILAGEGMSRWVGGLIGGAVGTGVSAAMAVACVTANEVGNGCRLPRSELLPLAMIGGGAALGVVLSGKSGPTTVYESNTLPAQISSSLRWTVAPMVTKNHKGAFLTIRW